MANFQDWLEKKYEAWAQIQVSNQSHYAFARFLDVGHSTYSQWTAGVSLPAGDDLARLAGKLGSEVYELVSQPRPGGSPAKMTDYFAFLPAAFQSRLSSAISEAGQTINQNHLDPESVDAKRISAKIFEKWGFKLTG